MSLPRTSLRQQFRVFFASLLVGLTVLTLGISATTLVIYYKTAVRERTYEVSRRFDAAVRETENALLFRTRILADIARIEAMGLDARAVREIQVQTLRWLKHDGLRVQGRGNHAYWASQGLAATAIRRAFLGVPAVQLYSSPEEPALLLGATPVEGTQGVQQVLVTSLALDEERLRLLALRAGGEILLYSSDGVLLTSSLAHPPPLQDASRNPLQAEQVQTQWVNGVPYASRTFPLRIAQTRYGTYAVLYPVANLRGLTWRLALWPLGSVAAALLLYFVFYRRVITATTDQISALSDWARHFTLQNPDAPPSMPRLEELAVLSEGFNNLVGDLVEARQELEVKNLALADANAGLEEKVAAKTRELEEQRRLLDSVLSGMRHAVFLLEPDYSITYANLAAREQFGQITGEELVAARWAEDSASEASGRAGEIIREGRIYQVDVTALGADGRLIWVAQDVTTRRNLEDQLQQSQRLESIGRLAGGVAHDFNNVLGSIVPCVDILRRRVEDPKSLTYLETIESAASRAAKVVRQLLTFSRAGEFSPRPLALNAAVDGAVQLLRPGLKRVQLHWNPGRDLPPVRADETQVQQVVLNLSLNAVDAMQGKGTITIETRACEDGSCVLLSVEDTGPGIPIEDQEKVFDPFFTTKEPGKGTGLGLSIVHSVVERHGGELRLAPKEGSGTRFEVQLPAAG